jgi:hypothetical protein
MKIDKRRGVFEMDCENPGSATSLAATIWNERVNREWRVRRCAGSVSFAVHELSPAGPH